MSELRGDAAPVSSPRASGVFTPAQRALAVGFALLILIAAISWLASLERDLPDIRTPRDQSSSSVLPGHALIMPGDIEIEDVDHALTGDWVEQEIGDDDWLATDLQGSRMQAAFYGTDVYVLARIGPDASRAYVTIDEEPVEHLARDDLGSYVSLWTNETSDQPIMLAQNLAHGEHLVEIIADGDGELAVSGFQVRASTPFPWAFVLGYSGLAAGVFLIIRSMLYAVNRQSSAVMANRSPEQDNSGH